MRKHADLIDADLHSEYGIDTGSDILDNRTWSWYRIRVLGLLTCESRIQRKLAPPEKNKPPKTPAVPRRR